MRAIVAAVVLCASVALGQNAPNVLTPGTPSRPVWVTGTVNVNALSLSATDGGGLTVTAPNPSVVDAGSIPNNVGTVVMGNNNGHMLVPTLDDAGAWTTNANITNTVAVKVYFDGGVVTVGNTTPIQVYFDGGTVTVSNSTLAVTQSGSWTGVTVQGINATNGAVTNPVMTGTRATNDSAAPTAVNVTNVGSGISDLYGRPMVQTFHPNHWSCNISQDAGLTLCQASPGSNLSLYITDINLAPAAPSTVALSTGASTVCDGGTVATVFGSIIFNQSPPAQFSTNLQTPIKLTSNQALCCNATTATTCNIEGFIAP